MDTFKKHGLIMFQIKKTATFQSDASVCCNAEVLKMLRHVTVNCHGGRVLLYLSKDGAVANPYSTFMKILLLNFVLWINCCALSRNGLPG